MDNANNTDFRELGHACGILATIAAIIAGVVCAAGKAKK